MNKTFSFLGTYILCLLDKILELLNLLPAVQASVLVIPIALDQCRLSLCDILGQDLDLLCGGRPSKLVHILLGHKGVAVRGGAVVGVRQGRVLLCLDLGQL